MKIASNAMFGNTEEDDECNKWKPPRLHRRFHTDNSVTHLTLSFTDRKPEREATFSDLSLLSKLADTGEFYGELLFSMDINYGFQKTLRLL
jgi:hypothetical protein